MYYSSNLFIKSVISQITGNLVEGIWEEVIVLVEATSISQAEGKINAFGKTYNSSYKNDNDELVQWTFDGFERISELIHLEPSLNVPPDGCEIFSRFLDPKEVVTLRSPVQH